MGVWAKSIMRDYYVTWFFAITDLRSNQGEDYLVGSREMARLLHSRNDIQGAKDAIEQAVNKFPDFAHTGGQFFWVNTLDSGKWQSFKFVDTLVP